MGHIPRSFYHQAMSNRRSNVRSTTFLKEHAVAYATASFNASSKDSRAYVGAPVPGTYWSAMQLSSFTFLMSGHGLPVCASMMLGDTAYAREQLRLACTFDDHALQLLAVGMLTHFTRMQSTPDKTHQWSH